MWVVSEVEASGKCFGCKGEDGCHCDGGESTARCRIVAKRLTLLEETKPTSAAIE